MYDYVCRYLCYVYMGKCEIFRLISRPTTTKHRSTVQSKAHQAAREHRCSSCTISPLDHSMMAFVWNHPKSGRWILISTVQWSVEPSPPPPPASSSYDHHDHHDHHRHPRGNQATHQVIMVQFNLQIPPRIWFGETCPINISPSISNPRWVPVPRKLANRETVENCWDKLWKRCK